MSSLPASIKIGYIDYKVICWPPIDATAAGRRAECDNLVSAIRVRDDLPDAAFAESLIHEILHALYYVFDIRDDDKEEKTVGVMATALATVWRDNPALIAFISGALA